MRQRETDRYRQREREIWRILRVSERARERLREGEKILRKREK